MSTPCYGCGDREIGCHSKCEKYAKYHKRNIQLQKTRQLDYACKELNIRGALQARKEKCGRYIYGRQG